MDDSIFTQYIQKRKQIIKNRNILQTTYIPEQLPHRNTQIDRIASIIAMALNGDRPSNIMVYGMTGTGKTAVLNYIGKELKKIDPEEQKCSYVYVNCEVVDTAYGILYNIVSQIVINSQIPFTGWSFEKLYSELIIQLDKLDKVFIVVLDEIDHMVSKKGDMIFYYLVKINENLKNSKVSLVGISNNMKFGELLEPKAKSRLGEENLIFPPYTKEELEDILTERAKEALFDDVLDPSVIPYCAILAAKVNGDARVALNLLKTAADIAERNGEAIVTDAEVKSAKNSIEFNVVSEGLKTLSQQSKIILMSIIKNVEKGTVVMTTGEVYTMYKNISEILGTSALTQRRVTDLISELDMMGFINASIKSLGRAGRTKEIELSIAKDIVAVFKNDPLFKSFESNKVPTQTKLL